MAHRGRCTGAAPHAVYVPRSDSVSKGGDLVLRVRADGGIPIYQLILQEPPSARTRKAADGS